MLLAIILQKQGQEGFVSSDSGWAIGEDPRKTTLLLTEGVNQNKDKFDSMKVSQTIGRGGKLECSVPPIAGSVQQWKG